MMKLLAKILGTYRIIKGPSIDGDIRGWEWRGIFYFDLREHKKRWWEAE